MFRSALKLVWNRRRANRLVVVEIAAAFLITFMLTAIAVDLVSNYRRPLGFGYENVLSVTLQHRDATGGYQFSLTPLEGSFSGMLEDVLSALRALPRTEMVAPILGAPYGGASRFESGLLLDPAINQTTADALQAIGVKLAAGRWFGPEDEGQDYRAVLVNRTFAERAFGSAVAAVGQRIDRPTETQAGESLREVRIVGVIEEFRQDGEFSPTEPYLIDLWDGPPADESRIASATLLLKTVPGTDASFDEQIVQTIESVAPGWLASVTSWEQLRASRHRLTLLPLKAGATIAALFIALVVMGVIGVLWQDVVRRTQEIGLRRAVGASAASVRRQIQLETLIVGAFGILIGAAIGIQIPLLELAGLIDWASSVPALALSAAVIMMLVLLAALYPSWLASRREPADALRYE